MMEDEKLRQWAIEQAIAMHGAQGRTMEVILGEAKKLLEFVADKAKEPLAQPK
jgi:hypothetical protein